MEQTGRLAEAEQSLRKAIYLDRDDTLAHFYLGLTLLRRGNRPAAVRALETVLDLTTDARPEDSVEGTDEMQVDHLRQLARMHLSLLAEQSTT